MPKDVPESGKFEGLGGSQALGASIGVALGVAVGVALDNVAVGVGIGVAVGVALGSTMGRRRRPGDEVGTGARPPDAQR